MKRDLRLERVYPGAAPARVWRALTDKAALSAWLMKTDFEPELGREFTFRDKPRPGWDGITHCKVIELEPPSKLAYTWRGGPGAAKRRPPYNDPGSSRSSGPSSGHSIDSTGEGKPMLIDTVVRWTLYPEGAGTRLVLEHTGFSGLRAVLLSFMLGSGWKKMMRTTLAAAISA